MNVTTRIKMNLRQPDITLGIDAVQGDCCSRSLEIILYSGIAPWMIPDGITVAVRYSKPDGTKGYYDTLPNGSTAWRIHDNLLTVALAPQMLTVAGTVLTQIEMIQGVKILSTFGLKIRVEANPAAGCMRSEDYVSWLQWIKDESEEHVRLIRQSQLAASQAAESAVAATESANAFASHAEDAAADAKSAAASAASSRAEAAAIAAGVSAIVAGNESYTKMESSLLYSPAITQPMTGENISISDSAEASFRGMTLLGKTTQNSTPTPEKPIPLINAGAEGSIDIRVSGKNLLHYPYNHTTKTQNGVTFTDNGDGSITIKGTASTDTWFHLMRFNLGKEWWSSKYKMSPYIFSGVPDTIRLEYSPMQKLTMITIPKGISIDTTVYPQVEINTAATVWEPPKQLQSITAKTPNGLAGIPVSSGGNYVDSAGQHWICDEIDFAKGKSIEMIGRIGSYNGEVVGDVYLSSTGILSNGAEVLYLLADPVETEISAEEMAAFYTVHTNFPNTVILNSARTGMNAVYIADVKQYIRQQIAAISV